MTYTNMDASFMKV